VAGCRLDREASGFEPADDSRTSFLIPARLRATVTLATERTRKLARKEPLGAVLNFPFVPASRAGPMAQVPRTVASRGDTVLA
jgi:hypothetical protein